MSGAGAKDVEEAKVNTSDLYAFMTWLDPYVKPRKTKAKLINVNTSDLYAFMTWLDPYVKPRKTKAKLINVDANEVEEEEEELAENVESHEEDNNDSSLSEISESNSTPAKIQSRTIGRPKYVKKARYVTC